MKTKIEREIGGLRSDRKKVADNIMESYIQVEHMGQYYMIPLKEANRIYINNPAEAPAGSNVQRGENGGFYYEQKPKKATPEEVSGTIHKLHGDGHFGHGLVDELRKVHPHLGPKKAADLVQEYGYHRDEIGNEDWEAQDNPEKNPLHQMRLTPDQAKRYGECHAKATEWAKANGGKVFTVMGRGAGNHSIAVANDKVYDYVLGFNGNISVEDYLKKVPFRFQEADLKELEKKFTKKHDFNQRQQKEYDQLSDSGKKIYDASGLEHEKALELVRNSQGEEVEMGKKRVPEANADQKKMVKMLKKKEGITKRDLWAGALGFTAGYLLAKKLEDEKKKEDPKDEDTLMDEIEKELDKGDEE